MVKDFGLSTVAAVISVLGWCLYQTLHNRRGQPSADMCNQEDDGGAGDGLESAYTHGNEGFSVDPILERKHKIFLSHSGAQKEFVEHLCKAFEDQGHYPFFDRRHESLPKGERFLKLIVQAIEQCEMLIVVVSNEYFMSKWTMIELSGFVQACKFQHGSNIGPKILALFYGLSASDLDNKEMQKQWFQRWKTLAEVDPKINVSVWKYAFHVLKSFKGLSYDKNLKGIVTYEEEIVSNVCNLIVPNLKYDDSPVQGKSRIYEVIYKNIEKIGTSRKYNVKVVGIYGVGGMGKTTTCKALCNDLSSKYEGRVCHIEFPSVLFHNDPKELFQKVLQDLTSKRVEVIQQLNEEECKDILWKSLFKKRILLAIDGILDNPQSIQYAKALLEVPHHKESLVVVTSRSQVVLEFLGLDKEACLEMLALEEEDAMKLFLHHATGGKQFLEDDEKHNILTCIRRCYFSKGNGEGHHYHPLALQALGLQVGCYGENPSDWVKNLQRMDTSNFFSRENSVFDILRSSFDLLSMKDQALFMDVGFFSNWIRHSPFLDVEWLCAAHNADEEEIAFQLQRLKRKGFLQDVDLRSRRISMHDLYLNFANLEAMGSFNESTNLRKWMCVYAKNNDLTELHRKPMGGCWHKLIRLCIKHSSLDLESHGQIGSMEGINWDYFSNVEVLQLSGLCWGHPTLNLDGLVCLRILELLDISGIDIVEGLQELKNLTYFVWESFSGYFHKGVGAQIVGRLPLSLKQLRIWGVQVVLGSDLLAQSHNLSKLELSSSDKSNCMVEACSFDLSNCWSLEIVHLREIRKLQALKGLREGPSNLHSLVIHNCEDLVDIVGIDHLLRLKKLHIVNCPKWEIYSLISLTKLQVLYISSQRRLEVLANACLPRQLQELHWRLSQPNEELNFIGFNQLEVLDLSESDGLTSLVEMGDLLALQCLNLRCCKHLLQLPNLSASRNLQEVDLEGCSALELHEKDIQMLSKLPLLQPILFSRMEEQGMFRLDLVRRKVLIHSSSFVAPRLESWRVGEWEERDLGTPPIKIGMHGTSE